VILLHIRKGKDRSIPSKANSSQFRINGELLSIHLFK